MKSGLSIYVGQKVRFFRKKNNLTQKELAEKLNVSESTVAKWEQGVVVVPLVELLQIQEILEIDQIEELLPIQEDGKDSIMQKYTSEEYDGCKNIIEDFLANYKLGSHVIVRAVKVFKNPNKKIHFLYEPDESCLDAWGRPLVYEIKDVDFYGSKKRKKKKQICVYLESIAKSGYIYRNTLDLMRIQIGYYYLEKCSADEPPFSPDSHQKTPA